MGIQLERVTSFAVFFLVLAGATQSLASEIFVNKAGPGMVLDADSDDVRRNGCKVRLWAYKDTVQQEWQLKDLGEGHYAIVCKASGLVLDAHSNDVDVNGCRVQLWEFDKDGKQQQWELKKVGEYYKIINRASGKVLDAHSDDAKMNGCRIQLWEDHKGDSCLWKIKKDR